MLTSGPVFSYNNAARTFSASSRSFREASPFPNVVLDEFLNPEVLKNVAKEFDDHGKEWIPYVHLNENKMGRNEYESFGPAMRSVIDELGSRKFLTFLGDLTGEDGLFLDPGLLGGGFHATARGGYLNIHTDFRAHPHHADWERVLNLLVYLNEGWAEEYGGYLELWDDNMKACRTKIAPAFNRAVIFLCSGRSFHGYPEPLDCPEGVVRKSIALYYYRTLDRPGQAGPTMYRARPADSLWKRLLISADNLLLAVYHSARMRLKFSDRIGGRIAKFLKFQ